MIKIADGVFIGADELVFSASRSGGPGGQNVNKVNTRVTVFFDVVNCAGLEEGQKRRILSRLKTRASKAGVIRVAAQRYRTQGANRRLAVERLGELLQEALKKRRPRKKTKVPAYSKRARLEDKKRRSALKQLRSGRIKDY